MSYYFFVCFFSCFFFFAICTCQSAHIRIFPWFDWLGQARQLKFIGQWHEVLNFYWLFHCSVFKNDDQQTNRIEKMKVRVQGQGYGSMHVRLHYALFYTLWGGNEVNLLFVGSRILFHQSVAIQQPLAYNCHGMSTLVRLEKR